MTWSHGGAPMIPWLQLWTLFTSDHLQSVWPTGCFSPNILSPSSCGLPICCSLRNKINVVTRTAHSRWINGACGTDRQHDTWAQMNKIWGMLLVATGTGESGLLAVFSMTVPKDWKNSLGRLLWPSALPEDIDSELVIAAHIYWGFLMLQTVLYYIVFIYLKRFN